MKLTRQEIVECLMLNIKQIIAAFIFAWALNKFFAYLTLHIQ